MTTWEEIETATRRYADARAALASRVADLEADVMAAKKRHLKAVRMLAEKTANARADLAALVCGAPALFAKPRTKVLHGIRIGFAKARGKLEWADAAKVVQLIRKHLADQAEVLIKVEESPVRSALAQLPAVDLKRIGVTVTDTGDRIVVESTDGEIDKLVEALLKEPADAADAAPGAAA